MVNLEKLYTVKEVAEYFGISEGSVYQKVHKKQLDHVKVGKYLRFPESAIKKYVNMNTSSSTTEVTPNGNTKTKNVENRKWFPKSSMGI